MLGNRVQDPRADSKSSAELYRAQPGRKAPSPRRPVLLQYLTGCRKWQDSAHREVPPHPTPEGLGGPPAPSPDSLEGNGAWHYRAPGPLQRAIHRPHLVLPSARSWWAPLTARTGALYEQCNHMGAQAPAFRSGKRCAASSLPPPPILGEQRLPGLASSSGAQLGCREGRSHSSPRPDYPPGAGSCISNIFRKAGGRAGRGAQRKRVRIRYGGG